MMRLLFGLLAGVLILTSAISLAWDGDWTSARSGEFPYDSEDSTGKTGVPNAPQLFPTTPSLDYSDVDPQELDDYYTHGQKSRTYTPYALARVSQELRYNSKIVLPPGYYLVKTGNFQDGSPNKHNLPTEDGSLPPGTSTASSAAESTTIYRAPTKKRFSLMNRQKRGKEEALAKAQEASGNASNSADSSQNSTESGDAKSPLPGGGLPRVFIIKKQSKVIAVIPIHHAQTYLPITEKKLLKNPFKKEKKAGEKLASEPEASEAEKDAEATLKKRIPANALAWVELEDRRPVLKFYYRHMLYSTTFQ
jgi:hypothetical protein